MAKDNSYKYGILSLGLLLLLILIIAACTCSEQFKNFAEWAKELGYPRPQGNLPNYEYGTKKKFRQLEKKQWDNVGSQIPSRRVKAENFGKEKKKFGMGVPMSKTVLV